MANEKQKMPPMRAGFSFMWFWGFVLLLIVGYTLFGEREQRPIDGDWNLVSELVEKGYVERINVLDKEKATVFLTEEAQKALADDDRFKNLPTTGAHIRFNTGGDVQYFAEQIEKAEAEAAEQGIVAKPVIVKYDRTERGWVDYFVEFLPWLLIIVVWIFFMRSMMRGAGGGGGGNIMNVGKARAQVFDKEKKKRVTFKDVAGLEEAKIEIMEIVDFLKKADKYKALGAKIPKGALLVGPPGTGKTLLAKAVAGEANVPFLSMSGSDFVEMFVGVGASRVRDLFDQAKKMAPCIVFIDEIDAIGRARGKNSGFSGNDERENTLNQLLTEMDGFQTNAGVIVLAATNRVDILDKALMRAGRFDRQIEVGLPDVKERKEIFDVHLKNLKLDDKLDREFLAKQTPGFAGADIANVCNEAALIAARNNKDSVTQEDFLAAIDRIVGGLERRNMPMSPEERRSTAIHEAGHAVVMWRLKNCDSVLKVTIIPRGRSLGATWYLPEERANHNVEHFMHKMAGMLGGRIAEQQLMGITSTGALNDLERTSQMAYAMVAYYGMSPKVGNISFYDSSGQRDMFTKPFSERTAELIDDEVRRLVDESVATTRRIIEEERENIERLADLLIEKETIFTEDIEAILGRSAQQIERDKREEAEKAKEAEKSEDSGREPSPEPTITYIVEPSVEEPTIEN
ncbi:MAG: ATP-dependent zinc metalloprotease FtsH [Rikenellaceae bacterium]|nr:ATP-dependent zinc metalloprotease FtsH [Rikenellaceae bacterium]